MADFSFIEGRAYFMGSPFGQFGPGTLADADDDNVFNLAPQDDNGGGRLFSGTATVDGILMPVFTDTGDLATATILELHNPGPDSVTSWPDSASELNLVAQDFAFCFGPGTAIATPGGAVAVEALRIGDALITADGRAVAVKWIGRQTVFPALAGPKMRPVMISKGALADGLPMRDLMVTADHGMMLDGLIVNASALVNDTTIRFIPSADLPQQITYFHVETENHDVILAEGAAAETFIDYAGRRAFDNHAEYIALYGSERTIPELPEPRVSSARMLPPSLKARLGIVQDIAA